MRWSLLILGATVACGSSPDVDSSRPTGPVALLAPDGLTQVGAEADPLAAHRPQIVDCPPATWGAEGGGFEVQTGACNYAAFAQVLQTDLAAGDRLSVIIWHDLLDTAEPALGHVALWLGSEVFWEAEVAIPSPSASLEASVVLERDVLAGERLGIHLHNHGFNSWRFVAVELDAQ